MSSQQARGLEQPVNPMNRNPKKVPFAPLLPTLMAQLDKDRALQLRTLYSRLKKNEIPKEGFDRHMRDIVGDQMLRLAVSKLQQVGYNQGKMGIQAPSTEINNQKSQSDPRGVVHLNQLPSSTGSSVPVQGLTKHPQHQMQLPPSSFPMYTSSSSFHTLPGPNNNVSGSPMRPHLHDSHMRHVAYNQTMGSTGLGGPSQCTTNMMTMPKFERPISVNDPSRVQGGAISHYQNNSSLPQNSAPSQGSSVSHVKKESVDQSFEQKNAASGTSKEDLEESSRMVLSTPNNMAHASSASPSITTQLDANTAMNSRGPLGTSQAGVNARLPPKKPSVGQKKPLETLGSSPPPPSKKQKVVANSVDQSIEHKQPQDLHRAGQLWENPSQVPQTAGLQVSEKNPTGNEPERPHNQESESQYLKLQKMSSQQARGLEQPVNAMNRNPKQVPSAALLPTLMAQLDKDRALQLPTLYSRLKQEAKSSSKSQASFRHRNDLPDVDDNFATSERDAPEEQIAVPQGSDRAAAADKGKGIASGSDHQKKNKASRKAKVSEPDLTFDIRKAAGGDLVESARLVDHIGESALATDRPFDPSAAYRDLSSGLMMVATRAYAIRVALEATTKESRKKDKKIRNLEIRLKKAERKTQRLESAHAAEVQTLKDGLSEAETLMKKAVKCCRWDMEEKYRLRVESAKAALAPVRQAKFGEEVLTKVGSSLAMVRDINLGRARLKKRRPSWRHH